MAGTWKRLRDVVTVASNGDQIAEFTFDANDYLKVVMFIKKQGTGDFTLYPNAITSGSNTFTARYGKDFGSLTSNTDHIGIHGNYGQLEGDCLATFYISNKSGEEKLILWEYALGASGDNAPDSFEASGKYTTKTGQITSFSANCGSGGFGAGTWIAVYGMADEIVTDEKAALTNIPTGTRYEETDTRKIYRRATNLIDGSDLKAYYKFDESSGSVINVAGDVTDNASLGSNADMTIGGTGTVSYGQTGTPSKLGNGMSFPATSSTSGTYGTCGTSLSQFNFLHGGTPKWTIAWWQKTSTAGGTNRQIFGTAVGDTKAGIVLYYYNNNLRVYMAKTHPTGNNQPISTNDSSVGNSDFTGMETDGNWHLYVVTMDFSLSSDNCKICKDDGTKHTADKHGSNTPDAITQNSVNSLGFRYRISNTAYIVPTAEYCEVSVWNRVLTDAEITQLYNSGAGFQLDTGEKIWKERGTA